MSKGKLLDKKQFEFDAVKLFRNCQSGILSTISQKFGNYPFGSYVSMISGRDRTIYLYLSDLAQHTKNFKKNSKCCMTLRRFNSINEKQDTQRLSIIGDVINADKSELDYHKNKYHQVHKESKIYSSFHDFKIYKFVAKEIRWIGGFGKIAWLDKENWLIKKPKWIIKENDIIDHMNKDHQNTIISALKAQHKVSSSNPKIVFLTIDGYYLKNKSKIYFIQLENACFTSDDYRKELVKLAKSYRKFEK